jgi:ATP-dependent helicase HrpB
VLPAAALPDLPIRAALGRVSGALDAAGSAVLVAPPGTGKTTLVPLALAADQASKVLVAEPRRLAARAAAARMAALLGEDVGERVGYSVRGDSRTSARTRVEVVTSGLLLRRLLTDPELPGTGTVVLDECHERHLDADLLLTLLLDARDGLRPDLRLLATSATVATGRLATLLGNGRGDAPVLEVAGTAHPVDVRYTPPVRGERIEGCVARAVRAALAEGDGDVLAFLPGVAEIRRTAAALEGVDVDGDADGDADVLALHGRLPAAEQDRALRPGPRRRVVLATAVAESSLTVPGVRAVVDAGLARVPRTDHRRGLAGLVTVRVSAAGADQRAGRAGREAPGRVYLRWWDAPPEGPLRAGHEVLRALGALVDGPGAVPAVTERGRRMAALGLHPRLARALLDGSAAAGARTSAEVVALLDDDTLAAEVEVGVELARLRSGAAPGSGRWRAEVARLRRLAGTDTGRGTGDGPALVVALAHPERLARRRGAGSRLYLMAGGTAVELPPGTALDGQEWLAVAVADRTPGAENGRVRLAAPADRALAERAAPALVAETDEVAWRNGDVVARHVRRLGAIVLDERRLPDVGADALRAALLDGLRAEGLGLLRWTDSARRLRDRIATLHRALGEPWPDVSDAALLADPGRWWSGLLSGARSRADLAKADAGDVLRAVLGWREAAQLDELAPERITVPSGSRITVDYSGERPVLAVRVQEVFGWTATPAVAGGRLPVVLHLLSPAGRPAAVTSDLASFWTTGYPQVRADLRGRYPKHDWPENPLAATPTTRPRRR